MDWHYNGQPIPSGGLMTQVEDSAGVPIPTLIIYNDEPMMQQAELLTTVRHYDIWVWDKEHGPLAWGIPRNVF